jgi:hypothetical protein
MHFRNREVGTFDHIGLYREVIQVLDFHAHRRFDFGKPPFSARQAFENIGPDDNVIEGEGRFENRRDRRVCYQLAGSLDGLGMLLRPFFDQDASRYDLPRGNAYVDAHRKYGTWFGFRSRFGIMPAQPQPARALEAGNVTGF